jgi:lipopolysaccharide/colanic/teichoic acid biosynthesis glycosyltransferase
MLPGRRENLLREPCDRVAKPLPTANPQGFYRRAGKRLSDIVFSTLGLSLLAPLFVAVTLLTKFTSRGPVFFHQHRVGKDGRTFAIVKFRSMVASSEQHGPPITVAGDWRVTSWGAFLRRHKIDELPQLWNVLKGEMSLVGPRPEVELYVRAYTSLQRRVLQVRPGITDVASLVYRAEERVLSMSNTPEKYYVEEILPRKLALNLHYIEAYTFSQDLSLIWKTVSSLFWKPAPPAN